VKDFLFYTPKTVPEAVGLLAEHRGDAAVISGGTDLVIELQARRCPGVVVNINKIKELRAIRVDGGEARIGAAVTFSRIEADEAIRQRAKALHACAAGVGSPQIRNLATIGGNVCNASVAGDSPVALLALDASVALESVRGRREMPLCDFYAGGAKTQIEADELLTEIRFRLPGGNAASASRKLGRRKALVIAVLHFAAFVEWDGAGAITGARAAIGAVSAKPVRLPEVEAYLAGKPVGAETFSRCPQLLSDAVARMIPTRASVAYKKESVKAVAQGVFDEIEAQARRGA
jgi:carbon-monoxide dehydrogenase medium subunit/xanthine dehydrogenase FAD-binding subunit